MNTVNDCSVIIIDDDVDLVTVNSGILTKNGINIVATGNDGNTALELYKKYNPTVILLDLKMPKFDGHYAIKHIKEFDPDAKIIIMTAYTEMEPNLEDVQAIIQKPTNIDDLMDTIKNVCSDIKK